MVTLLYLYIIYVRKQYCKCNLLDESEFMLHVTLPEVCFMYIMSKLSHITVFILLFTRQKI